MDGSQKVLEDPREPTSQLRSNDDQQRWIACEIHDGLVQEIVAAQWSLEAILHQHSSLPADVITELQAVRNQLAVAVAEARRMIRDLGLANVDSLGLVGAVQELVVADSQTGRLEITFLADPGLPRLSSFQEATIYRIVLEAIRNVERHAQVSAAVVRLNRDAQDVVAEIEDHGKGFAVAGVPPGRYGLTAIRERAALAGGHAEIESQPGRGTRVTVRLPRTPP